MSDSSDFVTPLAAGYVAGDAASDLRIQELMRDQSVRQRAQSIQDMYGAKTPDFEQFRQSTGKTTKWGKALAYAALDAIALAAVMAFFVEGALAIGGAAIVGGIMGGMLSARKDRENAFHDYENFVGDFAAEARAAHEAKTRQQILEAVKDGQQQGQQKQWTGAVDQKRAEPSRSGGLG